MRFPGEWRGRLAGRTGSGQAAAPPLSPRPGHMMWGHSAGWGRACDVTRPLLYAHRALAHRKRKDGWKASRQAGRCLGPCQEHLKSLWARPSRRPHASDRAPQAAALPLCLRAAPRVSCSREVGAGGHPHLRAPPSALAPSPASSRSPSFPVRVTLEWLLPLARLPPESLGTDSGFWSGAYCRARAGAEGGGSMGGRGWGARVAVCRQQEGPCSGPTFPPLAAPHSY